MRPAFALHILSPMPAAVGLLPASGAAGFRVGSTARDECLAADDAGAGFDASSELQQGLCPSSRYVEPMPPRGDALGFEPPAEFEEPAAGCHLGRSCIEQAGVDRLEEV